MKNRFTRPYVCGSLCILIVFGSCLMGQAQSGRRAPKPLSPPTSTAPITPPSKESVPPPSAKPPEKLALKQQTLLVGMDDRSSASYIPAYMTDAVLRGFTAKFSAISSVTVKIDRSMRRKQAIEQARKETENFVVMLQLSTENMGMSGGEANPEGLIITYFVLSPVTGKVKDQGRIYVRPSRSILGQRLPTARTVDAQLTEAGREAASRVMSSLHSDTPIIRR